MHVENITSNAMSLDRNGQSMLIQVYEKEIERLNNIINEAIDKLYCWGEILDAEFQQSMLAILNKGDKNE